MLGDTFKHWGRLGVNLLGPSTVLGKERLGSVAREVIALLTRKRVSCTAHGTNIVVLDKMSTLRKGIRRRNMLLLLLLTSIRHIGERLLMVWLKVMLIEFAKKRA